MTEPSGLTFEEAIARLEQVVSLLESGEQPLEDALRLFEEGTRLAGDCEARLKQAEQTLLTLDQAEEA